MARIYFRSSFALSIVAVGLVACLCPRRAIAQEEINQQQLAQKVVNPLTDMVSVPLQFNWLNNVGPEEELRTIMYFQPVVPMSISK